MTGNKVRRKLSVASAIGIVLLLFWGCGSRKDLQPLCIIHTNDMHGHILSERTAGSRDLTGGAAVLAAWISRVRRDNAAAGIPTLLLDAGDIFMGTPEGQTEKGAVMTDLMNRMGYDAMTVGNHEFDFGYYNLKALADSARFPFLGANVYRGDNSGLVEFLKPCLTRPAGDVEVLIVGITTDEIPTLTITGNVGSIDFKDPVSSAANQIKLFPGARPLVVVLSHLGLEGDEILAARVPDIDVIIGGHSHTLLETPEILNGVIICQAGSYGRWAGKLDLLIDPSTGTVADYEYRLFDNLKGAIPPDISLERELDRIKNGLSPDCRRDYGMSLSDLFARDREESCLGDIIADAMRSATGTDVAFENPYGIRWPVFKGEITGRDLFLVLPFEDALVTMRMTGSQIRRALEQSLTLRKGMLQVSGLRAEYDLNRPQGRRLVRAWVGEDVLEDEAVYSVTVNEFLAGGGDYFEAFTEGRDRYRTGMLLREALGDYIRKHTPLYGDTFKPERLLPVR